MVFLEVVVLFNAIIIVHELGHFLAARWRGLYVEEFGVWFGKPLWKKKINGVVYSLGSIPAGGFVKLPQLAPMEMIEGESETPAEHLPPISALDKIIVAVAGPLFSFALAVVFACLVWGVGKPVSEQETTTRIGYVEPGSPAEKAGLQPGDRILEVDGHPVERFMGMVNSVQWFVVRSEGETIPFKIERNGKILVRKSHWVKEKGKAFARSGMRQVHIGPASTPKIESLMDDSPAKASGLKPGDIVTHVNGKPIFTPGALLDVIEKAPHDPVALKVLRGSERLDFSVVPKPMVVEKGRPAVPRLGIQWDPGMTLTYPKPLQQIVDSVSTIGNMLGALFSSKSDIKARDFSGPVGIGRIYYAMLINEQGWRLALWFSVFFNVNLAILNMLPVPVLDGGHVLLALIEGIARRPVNRKVLDAVQSACALLLVGFLLYVTWFDVQDLAGRSAAGKEPEKPAQKVQK